MDSEVMPEIIPIWISGGYMGSSFGFVVTACPLGSRGLLSSPRLALLRPALTPGFDQIMNEYRKWPRFIPRGGATVSITVGESLTPLVSPLVDAWRAGLPRHATLGSEPTAPTKADSDKTALRVHQGQHADYLSGAFDPDESTRREITALLQNGLRSLGEVVEGEEGRFSRSAWSHSRRRESSHGLPAPEIEIART